MALMAVAGPISLMANIGWPVRCMMARWVRTEGHVPSIVRICVGVDSTRFTRAAAQFAFCDGGVDFIAETVDAFVFAAFITREKQEILLEEVR